MHSYSQKITHSHTQFNPRTQALGVFSYPLFGSSPIGYAIYEIAKKYDASLKHSCTYGEVKKIILNDHDPRDEGIDYVSSLISKSKNSFFASTYILDATSEAAKKLFTTIAEKQKQNPDFIACIAYNKLSSSSHKNIEELCLLTGAKINFGIFKNGIGRASLHSKVFISDNSIAVVGGDNIDNPKECDMLISVVGPIVQKLSSQALCIWDNCHSHEYCEGSNRLKLEYQFKIAAESPMLNKPAPMIVFSKNGIRLFGDYYNNVVNASFFAAIDNAKESINIMSPNLNDAVLLEKLQRAAMRGVQVRILIPKKYIPLASWIDRAANGVTLIYRNHLPDEFKANIQIRWYSDDGKRHLRNHTKYYSFDKQVGLIGSMNGDNQSFSFSRELMLGIDDQKTVEKLDHEIFESKWELGIHAKSRWWHEALPIPGKTIFRRATKALGFPIVAAQFLGRRTWQFIKGPKQ